MKRALIGKLAPKQPEPKKEKKSPKKKKKKAEEEDDEPEEVAEPPPVPLTAQEIEEQQRKKGGMTNNVFPPHIKGVQCNPGINPCLIKEVFYSPDAPRPILTLIESSNVYQTQGNFDLSLKSLLKARSDWKASIKSGSMQVEYDLYFEL